MTENNLKLKACEIRTVANGFWVGPGFDPRRNLGEILSSENVHVFETFDGLVDWLKNNLDSKNKGDVNDA